MKMRQMIGVGITGAALFLAVAGAADEPTAANSGMKGVVQNASSVFDVLQDDEETGRFLNGDEETNEYIYGDVITVEYTQDDSSFVTFDIFAAARGQDPGKLALFLDDEQLTDAVSPDESGVYTFTYDTGDGGIPVGTSELSVKTAGDMDEQDDTIDFNIFQQDADDGSCAIGSVTLSPKAVTAEVESASREYDGTTYVTVSLKVGDRDRVNAEEDLTLTAGGEFADANAGTGKAVTFVSAVEKSGGAASFYDVTLPASAIGTIEPRTLTVEGIEATEKVFDGTQNVEIAGGTLANVIEGEDVSFTLGAGKTADASAGTDKPVTALVTLSGADAANYRVTQPEVTVTIDPLPVTLSWSEAEFTYNKETQSVTATVENAVDGYPVEVSAYLGNTATDGGIYKASASELSSADYTLTGGTNVSLEWVINPAECEITVDEDSRTVEVSYGDDAFELTGISQNGEGAFVCTLTESEAAKVYGLTADTYAQEEEAREVLTLGENGKFHIVNAGSATVSVTTEATNNYKAAEPVEIQIEVAKQAVEVPAVATKTYDGTQQTADVEASDLYTVTNPGGTDAGLYPVRLILTDPHNYGWADGTATAEKEIGFAIMPLPVKLAWAEDTDAADGSLRTVVAEVLNELKNAPVEVTAYSGNSASQAGTYTAQALSLSSSNYTLVGGENTAILWVLESSDSDRTADAGAAAGAAAGMAADAAEASTEAEPLTEGEANTEAQTEGAENIESLTEGEANTEMAGTEAEANTETLTEGEANTEALTEGAENVETVLMGSEVATETAVTEGETNTETAGTEAEANTEAGIESVGTEAEVNTEAAGTEAEANTEAFGTEAEVNTEAAGTEAEANTELFGTEAEANTEVAGTEAEANTEAEAVTEREALTAETEEDGTEAGTEDGTEAETEDGTEAETETETEAAKKFAAAFGIKLAFV